MAELTHRQRLLCALNHQEADRVPMDLGSTTFTGIHYRAYERLKEHLGVTCHGEQVVAYSQVALPCEEVLVRLGVDARAVFLGPPDGYCESEARWQDADGDYFRDDWGVIRRRPIGGQYYDLHQTPLGHLELPESSALAGYPWPDPEDPGRLKGVRERVRQLRSAGDFAIVGHLGADVFLRATYLRGFEGFLTDLLINKPFAQALMEAIVDYWIKLAGKLIEEVGEELDVITLLDDIADQNGPFIAPKTYREMIKPMHARLIGAIRARTKAKILFHCCGSIADFMPDFVDLGVDALTPIQVSARGMDMEVLKREYGRHVTFWGGVDTHRVMPYGTPRDVKDEVALRLEQLAHGGGYVLCAVHNIQPDVPPQNVLALYESGTLQGRYPLGREKA